MKIVKIDKEQKKSKMKHIAPIVQSGIALGLTCFLIKTGIIDYNSLVNLDSVKDILSSINIPNLPFMNKSIMDISFSLVEMTIKTIGIQGIVIASKAFNLAKNTVKPVIESNAIKDKPIVHKIKSITKGKDYEKKQEEKVSRTRLRLIKKGLSIGAKAYLIATHQIDFNSIYNWDNLPHKLSVLSEMAKNIDLNKIYLGFLSIGAIKDFLVKRQHENKDGKKEKTSISFEQIVRKISAEKILPTFSSLKSVEQLILNSNRNKETEIIEEK